MPKDLTLTTNEQTLQLILVKQSGKTLKFITTAWMKPPN